MSIFATDIVLLKPQNTDDVDEGGGAPTANVIVNGNSNEIFEDVTEVARAGGKVSIKKAFAAVQTPNVESYMDPNLIVSRPPEDPLISVTMVSGLPFDTRDEASDRIASYLIPAPAINGFLLENHVIGQRSVQLFMRVGAAVPNIGRTLLLVQDEDLVTEKAQYVRVISVEVETRTYTESSVDYEAQVVTCEITDELRFPFAGSPPSRTFTVAVNKTKVRDTTAVDSGNYFGVSALKFDAEKETRTFTVKDIFTQLVPNARTETPYLDQKPASVRNIVLATSPRYIEVASSPHTQRIKIGQENRGYSFVMLLRPFPAPNTIDVSFRVLGQWYSLRDDGAGHLEGSGTGTVNYVTGSMSVTLNNLPDLISSIITTWGENTAFTNRSGSVTFRPPEYQWYLEHEGIDASSVLIEWTSGGSPKSATDNGSGLLSGDATGSVDYNTGLVVLKPTNMPDPATQFHTTYDKLTKVTDSIVPTIGGGGYADMTLSQVPVPGTVVVKWITVRSATTTSGVKLSSGSTTRTDTTTQIAAPVVTVTRAFADSEALNSDLPNNPPAPQAPINNASGTAPTGPAPLPGTINKPVAQWMRIGQFNSGVPAYGLVEPVFDDATDAWIIPAPDILTIIELPGGGELGPESYTPPEILHGAGA